MLVSLQQARQRVERRRSHKVRKILLLLGGAGAATAVVAVPAVRARVLGLLGTKDRLGSIVAGSSPTTITEAIEVDAPLSTVYNQWTQFEEFPEFMEGVESVDSSTKRLHWVAEGRREASGMGREDPPPRPGRAHRLAVDRRQADDGHRPFEPIGDERTQIRLAMTYTAGGPLERAGSAGRPGQPPRPRRPRTVQGADRRPRHRKRRMARRDQGREEDVLPESRVNRIGGRPTGRPPIQPRYEWPELPCSAPSVDSSYSTSHAPTATGYYQAQSCFDLGRRAGEPSDAPQPTAPSPHTSPLAAT